MIDSAVASTNIFLDGSGPSKRSEHSFTGPAYRAFPISGQILETSSFGNFSFTITSIRIINIAAVYRLALPHFLSFRHHDV